MTTILIYLAGSLAFALLVGCSLGRVSAKHRTDDEDRCDHLENLNAAELRRYAAGGWKERHRRIAEEEQAAREFEEFRLQNILQRPGGFDEIDRIYLDSEGMASDA